jgi:glycosyltransferase involved in cell wall biosynthesis
MRILVHDYAGHPFQIHLSRELARRGHSVLHAVASNLETPRGDLVRRPEDPACFEVAQWEMDSGYPAAKYNFPRRRSMEINYGTTAAEAILRWKPDVVISGNTPTEAQSKLVIACQKSDVAFYYWLQDFYSLAVEKLVSSKSKLLGKVLGLYYRRLDKTQFKAARGIVAISEDFAPILTEEFGVPRDKIHVIPNWAPVEQMPELPKKNYWSEAKGLDDKFVFLYSGTLGLKHNPDLLRDLAEQYRHDPQVRVIVISEGLGARHLLNEKERLKQENIFVLPYQRIEDLPAVLATGDVLISVLEESAGIFSVPSKVLSYLCAGRANLMAVPSVNLAARIVREIQAGITVLPSDSKGLLEAAHELFLQKHRREEMGRNARKYAETHFPIGAVADRFQSLFCGQAKP